MAVIHISEAEVAGDVPGLVARVLAGEEVVIDSMAGSVKVVQADCTDASRYRKTRLPAYYG
jgi:hypothetical protein